MDVTIPKRLKTTKAPSDLPTPWLKRGRTKWLVLETWPVIIDGVRREVPKGFVFDGSSIPRLLWWLFPPTYAPAWEASCYHDFCYAVAYREVSKQHADSAFRKIMLLHGSREWVANAFYSAVKTFGRGGW